MAHAPKTHSEQIAQVRDRWRGSAASRGYGYRWKQYRITYLHTNPLCVECLKADTLTPATVVDHIKPHRGDHDLFWDVNNHQSLCKTCHDRKTIQEDSGLGG